MNYFRNIYKSMNLMERAWVILFCVALVASTLAFSITGTDWNKSESIILNWGISPISAITGVLCVVWCSRYYKVVPDDYVLQPGFEP